MKNLTETPAVSPDQHPFVTRIYITKGYKADCYHYVGTPNGTHSKIVGFEINGLIHWIDKKLSTMEDLENLIRQPPVETKDGIKRRYLWLKVFIDGRGRWRNIREGAIYLDKNITKIPAHFENLPASYMKRSLPVEGDNYLWTMEQLKSKYYS